MACDECYLILIVCLAYGKEEKHEKKNGNRIGIDLGFLFNRSGDRGRRESKDYRFKRTSNRGAGN